MPRTTTPLRVSALGVAAPVDRAVHRKRHQARLPRHRLPRQRRGHRPDQVQQKVNVYGAAVPLQAGKTVAYLTLPNVGSDAVSGQVAVHIFATVIG